MPESPKTTPKVLKRQRAFDFIRPPGPKDMQGFRWTRSAAVPEVPRVEFDLEQGVKDIKLNDGKAVKENSKPLNEGKSVKEEKAAEVTKAVEAEEAKAVEGAKAVDGAQTVEVEVEATSPKDVDDGKTVVEEEVTAAAVTRKYAFAHFMVGNTYPYTIDDWLEDIKLAASHDIDGFVLNVGREEWQKQRCADCFAAARKLPEATHFYFFFSFDMTSVPGNSAGDVQLFRDYITPHYNSGFMFKQPGSNSIVVSTFSGENSTFGQGSMEAGWAYVKAELNKITPINFIPSFFVNPARYPSISAMDGAFNWNGGWPIQLSASSPRHEIENAALDSDSEHIRHLIYGARSFMAAVSPWFFTHYGPDTWNKNWIYRGDDWLFVRRWEQLIAMRDCIDIAQIISWNDYGESHYIGPIKGAQPNSQAWVDGYPHVAWLSLNRYFMKAFQTGTYPAITKDQIFLWARPHPRDANSADGVPRPNNYQLTDDVAWMVVFATAAATIDAYTADDSKVSFAVQAGMTKLSFPLQANGGMKATMVRDGAVVTECNPIAFRFESRPGVYNFNVCVAASP